MPELLQSKPAYGGIRQVEARWVLQADLVLTSAALIGGTEGFTTDMPVLRDPREGRPLLPGTSLAGALRSYLSDFLGGYGSVESEGVALLFGPRSKDGATFSEADNELGYQSPLIFFDSLGNIPEGLGTEIRDGVALTPNLGIAEKHKKFDFEVLPPGTIFPIRMELVVEDLSQESRMLALLNAALSGLGDEVRIGARRSRGLGAAKAGRWRAHRFKLTTAEGWMSWLLSGSTEPIGNDKTPSPTPSEAIAAAWSGWDSRSWELADSRKKLVVEVELRFRGGLLIRQPGTTPGSPDVTHLTSGGRPVVSGTSLAGALRHRALQIARTVRRDRGDADAWIDGLFGPRQESGRRALTASRVWVSEPFIDSGTAMRTSRIRIDRFTQGVAKGALFDEEPSYGGSARVRIEIRKPKPEEIGLLLLVVKDLILGDLPIGGTSSVGRGLCDGAATVWLDGRRILLTDGDDMPGEHLDTLDAYISKLRDAAPTREQEGGDQ